MVSLSLSDLRLGLGCMRLSSPGGPGEDAAIQLIHLALDLGVRLLDTADVYGPSDADTGHNERLLARALAGWTGARAEVIVATKGGLVRSGRTWRPDGRASHLRAACEASLAALGVEQIDLYQLHAPDPRLPLATSARALAKLRDEGLVAAVGLCNVNLEQLEEAQRYVEVASVQVALHPFDLTSLKSGLAAACRDAGIALLAHSPLGGPRSAKRLALDPVLAALAAEYGCTAAEIALAWLHGLAPGLIPLPGATREESVVSSRRALDLRLDEGALARVDERFPAGRVLRGTRKPPPSNDGREVVILVGAPAAGKSTLARGFEERGFVRLNRDERGGRLADLLPELERLLGASARSVVLDNTYPSRASRFDVVEAAWRHGVPVRCLWVRTPLEQAQLNAVERMLARHGRLLGPEEILEKSRDDPNTFGPDAQLRFFRQLEPPLASEGFVAIEEITPVAPARSVEPGGRSALIFDYDGVLRHARAASRGSEARPPAPTSGDVELLPGRAGVLRERAARGELLLGLSWQPDVGLGKASAAEVERSFARTHELLGVEIDVVYCPHPPGPPICWCRKPMPGLAALLLHRHRLDPGRCTLVGRSPSDRTFAKRLGFRYVTSEALFGST